MAGGEGVWPGCQPPPPGWGSNNSERTSDSLHGPLGVQLDHNQCQCHKQGGWPEVGGRALTTPQGTNNYERLLANTAPDRASADPKFPHKKIMRTTQKLQKIGTRGAKYHFFPLNMQILNIVGFFWRRCPGAAKMLLVGLDPPPSRGWSGVSL